MTGEIPGPRPLPAMRAWRYLQFFLDPIRCMTVQYDRFGELSAAFGSFQDGQKGRLFAFSPLYNQQILNDPAHFYSPTLGGMPDNALGRLSTGLVFLNGEQHKRQRRLVAPAFHKQHILSYHEDMVAQTRQMLDGWQVGQERDIARDMHQLTMRIVTKSLFGIEALAELESLGDLIWHWLQLKLAPLSWLLPYEVLGLPYHRLQAVSEKLEARLLGLIAEKRAGAQTGKDVLSLLLAARDEDGSHMTDAELIGQTNILFIAGHETSSNALTWTLFLLSQHPDVLEAVCAELAHTLGGAAPQIEQLEALPILENVIKESLRLLPPITWTERSAKADFDLGPYHLLKGSHVVLSHYITQRRPEIYEQPAQFKPDRWLSISPSTYEYMPFSGGPRTCIGAGFAMMEMKIVLAILLQRFRLSLNPKAQIDYDARVTLRPKYGMPMRVQAPDQALEVNPPQGTICDIVRLPSARGS